MPVYMPRRSPSAADPREAPGVYIACERNLYYVLGTDKVGLLELEDCKTLKTVRIQPAHVHAECRLVRRA